MTKSISEMQDMTGRVAVITGGAGHIGSSMAEALAEMGATLALIDVRHDALASTQQKIKDQYDVACHIYECDLMDSQSVAALPEKILRDAGRLDVLINNAAYTGDTKIDGWAEDFDKQSLEAWQACLRVNLDSPFILTQSAAPYLKQSGQGSIINIGSIYGAVGPDMSVYDGTEMKNPAAYSASKGGLIQFTRWSATVLAPHIRVNSISPGGIARAQPESFQKKYCQKTPLGRMGQESDLKGITMFLASDLSSYVTGQNIMVDGGWSAW